MPAEAKAAEAVMAPTDGSAIKPDALQNIGRGLRLWLVAGQLGSLCEVKTAGRFVARSAGLSAMAQWQRWSPGCMRHCHRLMASSCAVTERRRLGLGCVPSAALATLAAAGAAVVLL